MDTKPEQHNLAGQTILTDAQALDAARIIDTRLETFNGHRRAMLLEIKANMAYYVGEQNIQLMGESIVPLERERAIESVANVILPAVQKDIAIGTQVPPSYDIVPAGTDQADKATAVACQKIFEYLRRRFNSSFHRGGAILWYDLIGVGWRKVYWNPNHRVVGINPDPYDEDGNPNPGFNPDLRPGEAICQGDVEIDLIPNNQLLYDFRSHDLTRLDWIMHCKRVTAQWVQDRFGIDVYRKLDGQFGTDCKENTFEARITRTFLDQTKDDTGTGQAVSTAKMTGSSEMRLEADKYIDYYEYWHKPTKSMPTGMFAIRLGTQIVYHSPFPIQVYAHGDLPFIPAAPMDAGEMTVGAVSRISQARPLQREYNRLRSMIGENIDVMGNAVIMAPRGSKLAYRHLDNKAGNIIEYDGMAKPSREPGLPLNSQAFVYMSETKQAIDSIFAFHEPSRGVAPRNIDSAKGIMALQSADTAHMGPIVSGLEWADQQIVYQALTLAVANYEPQRKINVVGEDFQWTLYELDPAGLAGKFDVIVRPHSSMPKDREAEAMEAFSVWQSGLLGDPNDPQVRIWAINQMSLGNTENLLQMHSKQRNFAKKELYAVIDNAKRLGQDYRQLAEDMTDAQANAWVQERLYVPPINSFDDDLVHLAVHQEFMIDNYWKYMAMNNPLMVRLLQMIELHIAAHRDRVNQIQTMEFERQLRAEMLIKGKTMEQIAMSKWNPGDDQKTQTKGKDQ